MSGKARGASNFYSGGKHCSEEVGWPHGAEMVQSVPPALRTRSQSGAENETLENMQTPADTVQLFQN